MSRLWQKTTLVFALVILALGITAAVAVGSGSEEKQKGRDNGDRPTLTDEKGQRDKEGGDRGDKKSRDKEEGEERDKKSRDKEEEEKEKETPGVTTPQQPPATVQAPPGAPVTQQGVPSQPTAGVPGEPTSGEPTEGEPTKPQGPPLAPVSERKKLAETGLHPGLIALLGALCLFGGGFLFRKALPR
jgi:hypothetical protein